MGEPVMNFIPHSFKYIKLIRMSHFYAQEVGVFINAVKPNQNQGAACTTM